MVAAVHAENFRNFLRRDCTSSALGFVSSRFSQWIHSSAGDVRIFTIPLYLFVDFSACECRERAVRKCRRCATEMHRQVGVALREYVAKKANIMLARSTQETRIEAVGRNFRKFQHKKEFLRFRSSFDNQKVIRDRHHYFYQYFLLVWMLNILSK